MAQAGGSLPVPFRPHLSFETFVLQLRWTLVVPEAGPPWPTFPTALGHRAWRWRSGPRLVVPPGLSPLPAKPASPPVCGDRLPACLPPSRSSERAGPQRPGRPARQPARPQSERLSVERREPLAVGSACLRLPPQHIVMKQMSER